MEKYLLTKLFDRTFAQDPLDQERDQVLAVRMAALQFIKPKHLEIAHDFANDAALLLAQKELMKLNMHKVCRPLCDVMCFALSGPTHAALCSALNGQNANPCHV